MTQDGKTISLFENSDLNPGGHFRTPLPVPPLKLLDPPVPISEVVITWGGGGATDLPTGDVEFVLLGFPAFDTTKHSEGLIVADYDFEQLQWAEADERTMMTESFSLSVGSSPFFQPHLHLQDGPLGSKLEMNETGKISMYAEKIGDHSSTMSCHGEAKLYFRSDERSDDLQRDVEKFSNTHFFMKMNSVSTPPTAGQDYGCEDVIVHLWEAGAQPEGSDTPLNPSFLSSLAFDPTKDNEEVIDVRIMGCGETMGASTVYVDAKDEGKLEVIDENFLPEVLKAVEIEGMTEVAESLVSENSGVASGNIPSGRCHVPAGCFGGRSCDEVINSFVHAMGVEQPTCSSLSRDGCNCNGCQCGEGVGTNCDDVGVACKAPNTHLVCKAWPSGRGYIQDGVVGTLTQTRRKMFGFLIGSDNYCVPTDW